MARLIPLIVLGGLLAGSPALATSAESPPSGAAATPARPAMPSLDRVEEGANEKIKAACNPRRPSCRKWRALAEDRMQDSKNDN
jgi:hypothetical protein